jgi:hypothetical protein
MAGQMSEESAQAKRLFDSEKWDDAAAAMQRVANGDTGDDEGNKQLAAYHRAVALHHGGHLDDAAAAFLAIAGRPAHLKHAEALLWLVKLAEAAPVVVRGMAFYDLTNASRFNGPGQLDVYQGALFLMGRERAERGQTNDARDFFARVAPTSRWYAVAHDCLEHLGPR